MYSLRTNAIYCGDCAEVLRYFPENSVDLIYVDPPFFSNKKYEILWGNGYELRAFEDRWKGGIRNYIAWMEPKIRECRRVLKKTGSFYLHCDWHANAHLRILLDEIFGHNKFRNEIIWHYFMGGKSKRFFARKHDTIFFYTKGNEWNFNPTKHKRRLSFKPTLKDESKDAKVGKDDFGYYSTVTVDDVWDLSGVFNLSNEYLGYPTQKPETLLERIINASSNPTDIVLDPMCGGGTTIAIAHKLGRRWVGIDVSPTACRVMADRMQKLEVRISEKDILGLPKTLKELRAMPPFEFQNWVVGKLHARETKTKVGDMGIDGWALNGQPIQVKQSDRVGRNVVDNFETAMRRQGRRKGMIVAFGFGKGTYEEVARVKQEEGLEIQLKTVRELLDEV